MTTIAIAGDQWLIDGEITYSGTRCEGLLMNARMVNSTFEDTHRMDFDPDTNTTLCGDDFPIPRLRCARFYVVSAGRNAGLRGRG